MTLPPAKISSIKLGWAVAWPAFWTGFPLKMIVAVLLLAMQVPPWEGAGLVTLLVVSIPIDIWALGLTAKTVFLEHLGLEVKGPIALTLWWQGAALGGLVLGAAYYAVGQTVVKGQQMAAAIITSVKQLYPKLPIAEQITLELLLWSIPAVLVVVALGLVWLQLFGWRVKRTLDSAGHPVSAPLQERVRQWDYARIPADPPLILASFSAVLVLLTIAFWTFLPVMTPHPHPDYPLPQVSKAKKPVKPEELLKQAEASLTKAEAILDKLEEEKGKEKKKAERKGHKE